MKPSLDRRKASWTAAALCRFPTARRTAPEDWRTPKAVVPSPRLVDRFLAARHPDKARELAARWQSWATRAGVWEWDDLQKHRQSRSKKKNKQ